jgi:hypothetical protein
MSKLFKKKIMPVDVQHSIMFKYSFWAYKDVVVVTGFLPNVYDYSNVDVFFFVGDSTVHHECFYGVIPLYKVVQNDLAH